MEQKSQQQSFFTGTKFRLILVFFLVFGTLFFLFVGLTRGKAFLIPLTTAIILSMVMNPVAKKLKSWGVGWGWAVFLSDLVVVLFIGFMVFLLVAQANKVADNWPKIEQRLKPKVERLERFMNERLNIPTSSLQSLVQQASQSAGDKAAGESKQNEGEQQQGQTQQPGQQPTDTAAQGQAEQQQPAGQQPGDQNQGEPNGQQQAGQQPSGQQPSGQQPSGQQGGGSSGSGFGLSGLKSALTSIIKSIFDFLADMLLILVYIFFFMFYQKKFEDGIVGFAAKEKKDEVRKVIYESAKTAQQYLFGRFILIFILAAMYFLGYSVIGLQYALFISLLAAIFSLLPYVGNVLGFFLAIGLSFMGGGGGSGQLIGIAVIFTVVQFVESYILEPFVVGGKVDLNPVVVIVSVVLGGIVWGIMGMILAIPMIGIVKVIFDNVEELRPAAYMLDERGISSGNGKIEKVKEWVKKKFTG